MNGNSNDYALAKARMARTQQQAEQHQLAEELTADPKPTRESLLSRVTTTIRRRAENQVTENSQPTPAPNRKRYA